MSYQKLFISRPSEGTKPWPKFLAQKSLKKAKNNLKNLEKTKIKNNIPGLLQKQKSKKPRENQKKQYSRTLAKVKMQKSRKPKKPKETKKTMFQDSCLLTLSPDFWNIVFFCFFLVFSRFFGFLHFYFCKSPGILFFFVFFGFLEVF